MVSRTIFLKTNNFRRIRRALLAYVWCGGLALKGLREKPLKMFFIVSKTGDSTDISPVSVYIQVIMLLR